MTPEGLEQAKKAVTLAPRDDIDWFYQATIERLCAHIDTQAAQIEALKEKLVRERAENLSWQNWSAGGNGFRVYPGWEKMMPEARTQLKAEMPEVDWE